MCQPRFHGGLGEECKVGPEHVELCISLVLVGVNAAVESAVVMIA